MRALPLVLLAACATAPSEEVWLVDTLTLEGQPKPGRGIGFDLDGTISADGDPESCGHGDLLGLDGTEGVDNQFSALLPAVELVAGEAVHALVQDSIDSGELLLTLELVESREATTLTLGRAQGPGLTGADGALVAGQTLTLDPALPEVTGPATVRGARVGARGLTLDLPLSILGYDVPFTLERATMAFLREEGRAEGTLGGLVSIEQLQPSLDFVSSNGDPQIGEPVRAALDANADVDLDGRGDCDHLSLAVRFTAIPAWIYEETP